MSKDNTTSKLPKEANKYLFCSSKVFLASISAPLFLLSLPFIVFPKVNILHMVILSIASTLPSIIIYRLSEIFHLDKDILSIRRVRSYYNSKERNITLLKGALFYFISPWILMPLFSFLFKYIFPVSSFFKIIDSQGNELVRVLMAGFAWIFSCIATISVYDNNIIVKKWWYIQEKYDVRVDAKVNMQAHKEKSIESKLLEDALETNDATKIWSLLLTVCGRMMIFLSLGNLIHKYFIKEYKLVLLSFVFGLLGYSFICLGNYLSNKKKKRQSGSNT